MYAKVYSQILDSSLADDYQVRHVFEDLLKLADQDGIVDCTPEAIARRTNVPLEIVKRGLAELEKPDLRSKSTAFQGRRIVRLDPNRDWGWQLVNHHYYRTLKTADDKRKADRERVARQRLAKINATKPDTMLQTGMHAYTSASESVPEGSAEGRDTGSHDWTLQECLYASTPLGLPHAEVEKFYHHFSAQGWTTGAGRPITNLASKLGQWKSKYLEERAKATAPNRSSPNI